MKWNYDAGVTVTINEAESLIDEMLVQRDATKAEQRKIEKYKKLVEGMFDTMRNIAHEVDQWQDNTNIVHRFGEEQTEYIALSVITQLFYTLHSHVSNYVTEE